MSTSEAGSVTGVTPEAASVARTAAEAPFPPLTVIEVDRVLSMDEADYVRATFRAAVGDSRPFIIVGPGTRVYELEPYAMANRRAILALALAVVAIVCSVILGLVFALA